MISSMLPLALTLLPVALAVPAVAPPQVSARATLTDRTPSPVQERDILSDITGAAGYVTSLLGGLPDSVASGVPNFFQNFPTGDDVKKKLELSDDAIDALPTQVLNIPGYGNWTDAGWSLRFRGNVYKQPNISESKLNELADVFLSDVDTKDLPPSNATQARNLTASIYVLQQDDEQVIMNIEPAASQGSDGTAGGGDAVTPGGGTQNITLPYNTTELGDFDEFVVLRNTSGPGGFLRPGNLTIFPQRVNVYAQGASIGNATSYLVPTEGITIVSDIDDILRITKIYQPKEGLLNSFARPFVPWLNMPDVYANWSRTIPGFHFHYLTTTPEQVTRNYMEFIYKTYPGGSFDTRPLNFSDVSATLKIRKYLLQRVMETFPRRKFILVADTSNSDVMSAYPEVALQYPGQVQCIWLRNTSSTDPENKFPYNTEKFKDLNTNNYMFFNTPDDIAGIDIIKGGCVNASVKQDVQFKYQGLPFGLGKKSAAGKIGVGLNGLALTVMVMVFGTLFGLL